MMFHFYLNTKIRFGCGAREFIPEIIKKEKWTRIGAVVDHNLAELPAIKDILNQIQNFVDHFIVGLCAISEPTYDALEKARGKFSDPSLQSIIGIGGGSAIDMAKAMAVLVHNKKPAIEYRGFDMMSEPVLPIIAVPTTAGTGSEVTPNASFIDSHEKKKMGINGEAVRPRYAFLDPELTVSCPKAPTISAGVDSMVHAVEAYVARKTNPIARLLAKEGFQKLYIALPELVRDLEDIHLRQDVMYGAFLAGIALMHSGTGPAAAMSYPLGVHYNVPHGLGGGVFLPHVIEHNISIGCDDYTGLYEENQGSKDISSQDFLKKMIEVWKQLNIPENLSFCGFKKSDVESFIKETMELKGALDQNPVRFGANEIKKVILKLSQG